VIVARDAYNDLIALWLRRGVLRVAWHVWWGFGTVWRKLVRAVATVAESAAESAVERAVERAVEYDEERDGP
jgi:hypothetical protein